MTQRLRSAETARELGSGRQQAANHEHTTKEWSEQDLVGVVVLDVGKWSTTSVRKSACSAPKTAPIWLPRSVPNMVPAFGFQAKKGIFTLSGPGEKKYFYFLVPHAGTLLRWSLRAGFRSPLIKNEFSLQGRDP